MDIILDPFMGSDKAPMPILKSDRNFIDYEMSKDYIKKKETKVEPWNRLKLV